MFSSLNIRVKAQGWYMEKVTIPHYEGPIEAICPQLCALQRGVNRSLSVSDQAWSL